MLQRLQKTYFLQQLYFAKEEWERLLILTCLFSVGLALARVVYTGEFLFLSLIWNLFLAAVPFAISSGLLRNTQWKKNKLGGLTLLLVWLLFIPNSFYILTDLFHLKERAVVPLWFDLALILSFAWNGLLLGVLSVRQVEKVLEEKWSLKNEWLFIVPVMALNAFGIYLGRYLRYNSWDVVTDPFRLTEDIMYLLIHPVRNRLDWSMIVCFTLLMALMYSTLKKISKAVS